MNDANVGYWLFLKTFNVVEETKILENGDIMKVLSGGMYDFIHSSLPELSGDYFEIGVFNGAGFAEVARKNPEKICYAVDPFIEDGHTVDSSQVTTGTKMIMQKQNFATNTKGLTNIVLHETTSKEFLTALTEDNIPKNITMVVIDGDHHYDNVVVDFELALKLIGNRQGTIVVDDTDKSGVYQAYIEFVNSNNNRVTVDTSCGGSTRVLMLEEI
jgi:hypothetical protein